MGNYQKQGPNEIEGFLLALIFFQFAAVITSLLGKEQKCTSPDLHQPSGNRDKT